MDPVAFDHILLIDQRIQPLPVITLPIHRRHRPQHHPGGVRDRLPLIIPGICLKLKLQRPRIEIHLWQTGVEYKPVRLPRCWFNHTVFDRIVRGATAQIHHRSEFRIGHQLQLQRFVLPTVERDVPGRLRILPVQFHIVRITHQRRQYRVRIVNLRKHHLPKPDPDSIATVEPNRHPLRTGCPLRRWSERHRVLLTEPDDRSPQVQRRHRRIVYIPYFIRRIGQLKHDRAAYTTTVQRIHCILNRCIVPSNSNLIRPR